jgi:hypothetical protein
VKFFIIDPVKICAYPYFIAESVFTPTQLIQESVCTQALSSTALFVELQQTTSYALVGLARHNAVVWLVSAWTSQ